MKFRPTVEEITRISEQGKYDVVPVSCELMSDFITPIEVMRILKNVSTHCFMLESAQADDTWGRYTFLGFEPKFCIAAKNGVTTITEGDKVVKTGEGDPSEYIEDLLKDYTSPKIEGLPSFTGGLVGYFAYDYVKYAEKKLNLKAEDNEGFARLRGFL